MAAKNTYTKAEIMRDPIVAMSSYEVKKEIEIMINKGANYGLCLMRINLIEGHCLDLPIESVETSIRKYQQHFPGLAADMDQWLEEFKTKKKEQEINNARTSNARLSYHNILS